MICKKCVHESYCDLAQFGGHIPPITACSQFKEKSQTNADRIRAMTDEELAEWLGYIGDAYYETTEQASAHIRSTEIRQKDTALGAKERRGYDDCNRQI